jgi:hypothetical protein
MVSILENVRRYFQVCSSVGALEFLNGLLISDMAGNELTYISDAHSMLSREDTDASSCP